MALKDEEDEYTFDEAMNLEDKRPLSLLEWLLYLENKEIIDKKLKEHSGEPLKTNIIGLRPSTATTTSTAAPGTSGRPTASWATTALRLAVSQFVVSSFFNYLTIFTTRRKLCRHLIMKMT